MVVLMYTLGGGIVSLVQSRCRITHVTLGLHRMLSDRIMPMFIQSIMRRLRAPQQTLMYTCVYINSLSNVIPMNTKTMDTLSGNSSLIV